MSFGSLGSDDSGYGDLILGYGSEAIAEFFEDCSNSFGWAQVTDVPYFLACSNDFGFTDSIGYDWEEDIIQYFGFTPRTILPASNTFGFESQIFDVYTHAVVNTFNFVEVLERVYEAVNVFGWSQVLVALRVEDCFNEFNLSDSVNTGATNFSRGLTDSILKQHLTYSISGARCADKEYAPLVGESGDDSYGEIPISPPVLADGTLTLTYPRVAPTTTLVLKNPEFGNSDTLSFTLIDRTTRGGDWESYGDPKWSKSQVFRLEIHNLCDPDSDELVDFLNESLGKEIGLADWEGRNWAGVIIAPNTVMTNDAGGYRVTLEFQGELVE